MMGGPGAESDHQVRFSAWAGAGALAGAILPFPDFLVRG